MDPDERPDESVPPPHADWPLDSRRISLRRDCHFTGVEEFSPGSVPSNAAGFAFISKECADGNQGIHDAEIGGHLIVSYRGYRGSEQFGHVGSKGSVNIQLLQNRRTLLYGPGSDQTALLRPGESYFEPHDGLAIVMCEYADSGPTPSIATIGLGHSYSRLEALSNARSQCGPPPPPPSPPAWPDTCRGSDPTRNCDTFMIDRAQLPSTWHHDYIRGMVFYRSNPEATLYTGHRQTLDNWRMFFYHYVDDWSPGGMFKHWHNLDKGAAGTYIQTENGITPPETCLSDAVWTVRCALHLTSSPSHALTLSSLSSLSGFRC